MTSKSCGLACKNNNKFLLFCENPFHVTDKCKYVTCTSKKTGRAAKLILKKDNNIFDKLYAWKMPIFG